jgi:hypothetical protein
MTAPRLTRRDIALVALTAFACFAVAIPLSRASPDHAQRQSAQRLPRLDSRSTLRTQNGHDSLSVALTANRKARFAAFSKRAKGLEPSTYGLGSRRSTN